jgi:hypothetical protein
MSVRMSAPVRGRGDAVQARTSREDLAAPARDEEHIGTPPLVRRGPLDLPEMRAAVPAMDPRGEHQAVEAHHAANALAVVAGTEGAVHHGPDAPIAVRGAAVGDGADLLEHGLVVDPPVEAGRPGADPMIEPDRRSSSHGRHSDRSGLVPGCRGLPGPAHSASDARAR